MSKKTWENITGPDVSDFILKRMDKLDELGTGPRNPERDAELQGHKDELQIIADHLRRLNEDLTVRATKPVTYFFLTIEKNRVVVEYDEFEEHQMVPLKSYQFWLDFIAERKEEARRQGLVIQVMASSSMDFPHEYTDQQTVVDLARAIRSRPVTV